MKVVYLAHPFGGKQENVENAERLVKQLIKKYPDCVFLSPLQAVGFYYNDVDYITGVKHCLEMLSRCDELWLYEGWEDSMGCFIEYTYATQRLMPIKFINKQGGVKR